MELKGRTAWVTGSTSGIGLGVARSLAARGCDLVVHGLLEDDSGTTLTGALARDFGVQVRFSGADLRDREASDALMSRLGPIDILINNAGLQHTAPVESFGIENWDRLLEVNLTSAFRTIAHFLPGMRERGWGRIVNIASVHGLVGSPQKAAYVASKHGLIGLTKVVALESARTGVTCNAICPGWVLTPLVQAQIDARAQRDGHSVEEAMDALLAEKQPSRRFATAAEIGEMTAFLCGPGGQSITGASLTVDGGWTAQ